MINILYEDNHILVVEKPVNIPVQEDSTKDKDLLNILKQYLKDKYDKPGNVYLGLIHRLDRPVGGVMVFAKTSKAASRLSEQVRNNQMIKIYHAIVIGKTDEQGLLNDRLLKDKNTNIVTISNNGKLSQLHYEKVWEKSNMTLVKVKLITGRSHQIRVQFSSRGNYLFGDQKYSKVSKVGQQLALFASSLTFKHPTKDEMMTFTLPLPNNYPWNL